MDLPLVAINVKVHVVLDLLFDMFGDGRVGFVGVFPGGGVDQAVDVAVKGVREILWFMVALCGDVVFPKN